jgi:hypothetical protein
VVNAAAEASKTTVPAPSVWTSERTPWSWRDILAILVWTLAIVIFFHDAALLQKALFYFDVTEINYPYRDFLAREMKLGRFAKWMPGLYNGFPLYAESQAGYWHPLKYVLYPFLKTWQAFNLDTVLSVWLTGMATYGWLRRHVGAAGALTGAAIFGLSGFVWAHLIHTSMTNALISVPLTIWALEVAWDGGKLRGLALGSLALACQVFAGHLQDTILTAGAVGFYALHRALTETNARARLQAFSFAMVMVALGMVIAAVQWVPSKNLLDRSPRSGGLTWDQLTYGSWSPELLPTLVVREIYGTRARDTDWADGYYPYHEMNAYLGLIGLGLAVIGAAACRDRWVSFWIALALIGSLCMLGRYTFLFDFMHKVPVLGSSRIPVRYHLWVSLAVAALASVGVDRLTKPGVVKLRGALILGSIMVIGSIVVLIDVYGPIWNSGTKWNTPYHLDRFRWLGREIAIAVARTLILVLIAWSCIRSASKSIDLKRRARFAAVLPVLIICDLLGSHDADVPTIDPAYWTKPPATVEYLKSDPTLSRILGAVDVSSGQPGYASERLDFMSVRDTLPWSLAPVWGLRSNGGETPIFPKRILAYNDHSKAGAGRLDIEGVTHVLSTVPYPRIDPNPKHIGKAYVHRNATAFPRARLAGMPVYAKDESEAVSAIDRFGLDLPKHLIVEDPDRPLAETAKPTGTAEIVKDDPEHVEIQTQSDEPSYLVLSDTFDPGWTATVDGTPAPIRPAYVAYRAIFLSKGNHRLIFEYVPAGFKTGLTLTLIGLAVFGVFLLWPRTVMSLEDAHCQLNWPKAWPLMAVGLCAVIVIASSVGIGPDNSVTIHSRWQTAFHKFTWGDGVESSAANRTMIGR